MADTSNGAPPVGRVPDQEMTGRSGHSPSATPSAAVGNTANPPEKQDLNDSGSAKDEKSNNPSKQSSVSTAEKVVKSSRRSRRRSSVSTVELIEPPQPPPKTPPPIIAEEGDEGSVAGKFSEKPDEIDGKAEVGKEDLERRRTNASPAFTDNSGKMSPLLAGESYLSEHVVIETNHCHYRLVKPLLLSFVIFLFIFTLGIVAVICYNTLKIVKVHNESLENHKNYQNALLKIRNDLEDFKNQTLLELESLRNLSNPDLPLPCQSYTVHNSRRYSVHTSPAKNYDAIGFCENECHALLAGPTTKEDLEFVAKLAGADVWVSFYKTIDQTWKTNMSNGLVANWIQDWWAEGQPMNGPYLSCVVVTIVKTAGDPSANPPVEPQTKYQLKTHICDNPMPFVCVGKNV